MDANRFDTLTRALTEAPSRRSLLHLGMGGGLAALLGRDNAEARKRGKGKKKKKKNNGPPRTCNPACASFETCDDGTCCRNTGTGCVVGTPSCCNGNCIPNSGITGTCP